MTPITVPPIFYDFASDYDLDATEIEDGKGLDDMGNLSITRCNIIQILASGPYFADFSMI